MGDTSSTEAGRSDCIEFDVLVYDETVAVLGFLKCRVYSLQEGDNCLPLGRKLLASYFVAEASLFGICLTRQPTLCRIRQVPDVVSAPYDTSSNNKSVWISLLRHFGLASNCRCYRMHPGWRNSTP